MLTEQFATHGPPQPQNQTVVEIGKSGFPGGISVFVVQTWLSIFSEISVAALWQVQVLSRTCGIPAKSHSNSAIWSLTWTCQWKILVQAQERSVPIDFRDVSLYETDVKGYLASVSGPQFQFVSYSCYSVITDTGDCAVALQELFASENIVRTQGTSASSPSQPITCFHWQAGTARILDTFFSSDQAQKRPVTPGKLTVTRQKTQSTSLNVCCLQRVLFPVCSAPSVTVHCLQCVLLWGACQRGLNCFAVAVGTWCIVTMYSRVPGSRNHGFWPSQRVSKHTLMKSATSLSINH